MSDFIFDGKRIFYEETGNGMPLLLLHGNTASAKMYAQAAAVYSRDFRVICMDFLGHGRSERLAEFPADLWFYEAQQVIAFLREKQYTAVNVIGASGGAIVGLNAALEAPGLFRKIIADSFAGESASEAFTQNLLRDRASAKADPGARGFYEYMHGSDWVQVVSCDTDAVIRHQKEIGRFFHTPLHELRAEILLTGSREDPFMYGIADNYYETAYGTMLERIPHGRMYLFPQGGHPAMMSNFEEFHRISLEFLR